MSNDEVESLVEQRIAQLEAISERRNALLREMYLMMKKRSNVGAVIAIDDDAEDDLHVFLSKYDLRKNPETGYLSQLPDNELFDLVPPQDTHASVSPPPLSRPSSRGQSRTSRSKSVLSDLGVDTVEEGGHNLRAVSEISESDDELDLIGPSSYIPEEPTRSTPSAERSGNIHISDSLEFTQIVPVGGLFEEEEEKEKEEEGEEEEEEEESKQDVNMDQGGESLEAQPTPLSEHETDSEVLEPLEPISEANQDIVVQSAPLVVHELAEPEEVDDDKSEAPAAQTNDVVDVPMSVDEPAVGDSKQMSPSPAIPDALDETPLVAQVFSPPAEVQPIKEEVAADVDDDISMVLDSAPIDEPPAIEPESETTITQMQFVPYELAQETPKQMKEEFQEPTPSSPSQLRYPTFPLQLGEESSTPEPAVKALPPSAIYIPVPISPYRSFPDEFQFSDLSFKKPPAVPPTSPIQPRHQLDLKYPLPPIDSLPAEFNRKVKKVKQKKKEKEKEKDKGEKKEKDGRDDWAPWGIVRWHATVRANPVYKRLSKANKCLSTRDWGVAMSELKLLRTMDRIDMLKSNGRWSFRQPKKQRGAGGTIKTHWDYLMDEMKWMRTDFREERKWKMALAYNLSTAVLEWHAAGTWEKRVKRGICVLWKPPRQDKRRDDMMDDMGEVDPMDLEEPTSQAGPEKTQSSLLMLDYGSDDEEDDDQEKDVDDALDPAAMIEETLAASEQERSGESVGLKDLEPKTEEIEDSAALQDASMDINMNVDDAQLAQAGQGGIDEDFQGKNEDGTSSDPRTALPTGLKKTSENPMLHSKSNSQSSERASIPHSKSNSQSSERAPIPHSKASKISLYAPVRERIAYSEVEKLFLDIDDFHITSPDPASVDLRNEYLPAPSDLSDILPDFQAYGLLEVAPTPSAADGKKKSERRSDRDDPNKRVEEAAYTKIYPASKFMCSKPTLIGALQPSKHFKDGHWHALDESAILVDYEGQPTGRLVEDFNNSIFEHKPSPIQIVTPAIPSTTVQAAQAAMQSPLSKFKEPSKRTVDHVWTTSDDALLKSLVDKYPNNWDLIAECYNTSKLTVKTDWRTSRDCQERWRERWAPGAQKILDIPSGTEGTPPPSTSGQVTTRGVKRLASNSVSSTTPGPFVTGSGSEPKKRRRHAMVQDAIRKSAKRRSEALQKNSVRKTTIMHESHSQYNKMAKMSPADLSRRKAEQDMSQNQQLQLARARAAMGPNGQAAGRVPVAQGQPVNGAPVANGVPRPPTSGLPAQNGVPQIRSQVNISQQQRSATPLVAANSRLSPQQQQLLQVQAQSQSLALSQQQLSQALAQVQAHQAMQAQQAAAAAAAGDPSQPQNGVNVAGAQMANAHLSPPYGGSRDATSSPAHASPPRTSATPSNAAVNSPRPPSAQAQTHPQAQAQVQPQPSGQQMQGQSQVQSQAGILQSGSIAAMNIPRATTIQGHYYLPNVQNYTHEQIQNVLRLQALQQAQQQAQQQHGMNQPQNGAYPQQ